MMLSAEQLAVISDLIKEMSKNNQIRDPKRIDVVCEEFRRYWHKHPDLRFVQILDYVIDSYLTKIEKPLDPFFIEEEYWITHLIELNKNNDQ